jgi:CheY-like chemotaxis protein
MMHPAHPPQADFVQEVRSALSHLYDHAYLQNHPLGYRLVRTDRADAVTRAQQLRRTLLDCIEALRPQGPATRADDARAYAVLAYRCVDGLSMPEIENRLSLSRRQAYREYSKGVEAVAGQLWDQLQSQLPIDTANAPTAATQRLAMAQAEVERLRKEVRIEPLVPTDVLEDVLRLLAPRLARTATEVTVTQPSSSPAVLADRTMLRQALVTLLSHGLDAETGAGEIQIDIQPCVGGVQIEIAPITSATDAHLAHPGVKREGVGLAVAQNLVEAQGGQLRMAPPAAPWRAQLTLPTAAATVLVVDDNENLVALFQRYLGGHRVNVLGATSGVDALQLAVRQPPEAIILDVMMPHRDGWDILQALQSDPATRSVPVIVCSVLNEPGLALDLGASDYLTKPVSQTALLAVLQRWLGRLLPAA